MKREVELRHRLRSLETLGEAVGAMKSLSAHHFREARRAVGPARTYREGVERILASTGAAIAPGEGPAGLLIVGGELGLCGSYNARLVVAAAQRRAELGEGPTLCVGHRAAILLARRNVEIQQSYPAPTGVGGLTELLLRLAEDVLTLYVTGRLSSFDIVSSRFGGVGAALPSGVRLLPLAPKPPAARKAARYVTAERLASAAVREYLYIVLYDLLLDALASEHSARLVATQSAEKWLDHRTATLHRQLASAHREASTQEVIEIAGGVRGRAGQTRRTTLR
ncbi:MAG: F0F1 ATP synthase subunit gamma [Myxococcales bacterium]